MTPPGHWLASLSRQSVGPAPAKGCGPLTTRPDRSSERTAARCMVMAIHKAAGPRRARPSPLPVLAGRLAGRPRNAVTVDQIALVSIVVLPQPSAWPVSASRSAMSTLRPQRNFVDTQSARYAQ